MADLRSGSAREGTAHSQKVWPAGSTPWNQQTVEVWSLGGDHNAMSCHARIPDMHMDECETVLVAIRQKLYVAFAIDHVTIQLERAGLPAHSGYVMPEPAQK